MSAQFDPTQKRTARIRQWFQRNKKAVLVGLALLIVAAVPSYYFYDKSNDAEKKLNNPGEVSKEEAKEIVKKIGKHLELPNEEPTLATVTDTSKLAGQPFFSKAKQGDKVLVYSQARKAILYRPSEKKVIEVAPLSVSASPSPAPGR